MTDIQSHFTRRARLDEGADDNLSIVARLNDRWRVIECQEVDCHPLLAVALEPSLQS